MHQQGMHRHITAEAAPCARTASDSTAAMRAVMAVTVFVISLAIERLWIILPHSPYFASAHAMLVTAGVMSFGGVIAFLMVWTEFTVIQQTSALTFMVAGTFKELVTGPGPGWPTTRILVAGNRGGGLPRRQCRACPVQLPACFPVLCLPGNAGLLPWPCCSHCPAHQGAGSHA